MKPRSKGERLLWFAVLVLLALCVLFFAFVASTRDGMSNRDATRTQNAIERMWDEELHLTLTAESGRK